MYSSPKMQKCKQINAEIDNSCIFPKKLVYEYPYNFVAPPTKKCGVLPIQDTTFFLHFFLQRYGRLVETAKVREKDRRTYDECKV